MTEPFSESAHFAKTWQQQLAGAFHSIDDLCAYLNLRIEDLPVSLVAAKNFAFRVPVSFAASMVKGSPLDPLLRQVLPVDDELLGFPGFSNNPVGDLQAAAETGVLHKYQGRVLLINTGSCAINCRYCFRRNFPYSDLQLTKQSEATALKYIQNNTDIAEVILSGGDPLLLSDARLAELFEQLNSIQHVKRIRIHSRLPIVLPARVTDALIQVLTSSPKQTVVVVHCNHANEISARVVAACRRLNAKGITLLNQSVLLKGVNDDATVLTQLSEQLFALNILPYYLHLLDKASGTGHFDVSESVAVSLLKQVQGTLPGYLVPKLVREIAGEGSKSYVF